MAIRSSLGRRFWYLWAANTVSSVGDGMVLVALPLLAVGHTRNPMAIAGVMAVGEIPVVLASLPVGAIADRVNRRRLIVRVEYLRFAALAVFGVLVLAHMAGLAAIYGAAFVLGTLDVVFDVSATSVLPSIVEQEQLASANSHLMNAEAVGQEITGRAAGGALLAASTSLPFLADAASFVASAVLISKAVPSDEPLREGSTSTWDDLRSGLTWYFRHPVLRRLTVLVASLAFCQAMVMALAALWAREDLRLSDTGYGLLLAVASIGNIIGAALAPRLRRAIGGGPMIVGVALFAAAAYPVMALTHSALVAAAALTIEAATVVAGNIAAATMRQTLVPAEMQGRGVAAYRTVILGCIPFGGLLGGALASGLGIRRAFLIAGAMQMVFLVVIGPALVRRTRRPIGAHSPVIDLTEASAAPPTTRPAQPAPSAPG